MGKGIEGRAGWERAAFPAAAALLLALSLLNAGWHLQRLGAPENGQDFAAYYVPAAMLRDGSAAIYEPPALQQSGGNLGIYPDRVWPQPYLYPPGVAQALMPLTLLPYASARVVWLLVCAGALLGALAVVLRATPPGQRRWTALLWLTLPHHVTSLYMGQADTLVTALLALGLAGLVRQRAHWTGTAIAVAAAIKVTPALVAVALLRHTHGLARAALVGAATVTLSGLLAWAQGMPLLWLTYAAELPQLAGITRDWVENVSLSAALRRLFLAAPHPLPGLPDLLPFLTVTNLLAAAHLALAALLLGAVLGGPLSRKRPALPGSDGVRRYALAVVWLLLAAPITWPSTLSLLVIPVTALAGDIQTASSPRRIAAAGLVIGVLWLPNAALPFLPLGDWSYLRTSALLGLFTLIAFPPTGVLSPQPARRSGVGAGSSLGQSHLPP